MKKTESLLKEIHLSMLPPIGEMFDPTQINNEDFNPFDNGSVLRESIYYGGESAYNFQYRDLASLKYKNDNEWLIKNKGFSVQEVVSVVTSTQKIIK